MSKLVFISWAEDCSRSDNIARQLGGTSHMIYSPEWGSRYGTILFKYISQSIKTLTVLFREGPRAVLVMTPPTFACLPVWLYCLVTRTPFLIDAHSGAFINPRWERVIFLHKFFSRHAQSTMVTNAHFKSLVESWGASALLVPDVPVKFAEPRIPVLGNGKTVAFVCTFARDEPVDIVFAAARELRDVSFFVTGDPTTANPVLLASKPDNVTLTGFIPRADYVGLLHAVDVVMTLTTLDNTMQRGAYEGIYLGKPVITANQPFLRREFPQGTVHADLTTAGVSTAIRKFFAHQERLQVEAAELRSQKLDRWETVRQQIESLITT